ncbi:MAG TPA: ATP-binding cassette domain-containing protein [Bacteroidia bacterium]|jgi:phospholipid/cholesterol/gamma-HCH transport system ATP-binding protein|nr:ATP-binding cassette domain-containing protein [Bacteroidia bacterium]MCW5918657.1 ATP-binding cassette domain-containing protein [Bacteroidota bacterium]HCI58994.1 ABC transporter ATP-binding protein [Bacteroidota bacterium]HMU78511.1 ATP-binding cassette domain-containing protein [Bacteroidia bacterium]HMW11386.1 ATP-binding cassette domain-containing protein [Bacteroidia bacterium]
MIAIENISKSFGNKKVLEDVSCEFDKGKINLIIGGSGQGKTVLMKCAVGLFEVDKGKVLYDGRNFSEMTFGERKPIRQEIGMLFQGGALFDSLTVEQNVTFPLKMFTNMTSAEKRDRANFCLHRVNLENVNHLLPSAISGGMKKRVAIARAIAMNPKYLFCDEPNSGLDPKTSILIDELIKEITEEYDITTVINTHDMNTVMSMGEKIIFIYKGKKFWEGNNEDIMRSENKELNDFVFASRWMQAVKKHF